MKQNITIRRYAKEHGVKMWQVAEVMKMHESALSVKLRKELPDQEREKILKIIAELVQERQEAE